MKIVRIILALLVLVIIITLLFIFLQKPPLNRNWSPEFSKTANATLNGDGTITLHNVRDWTYSTTSPITTGWRDMTVDPTQITSMWFITEPFSSWKAVGHTFLSFQFKDGTTLSFSIEAKRVVGQGYSAWAGEFNTYGLAYQWGTERDFVTRRLIYLNHPVRLYPLNVTPQMAQALFVQFVKNTNVVAQKPRFYNTLLANCTNSLAYIVNNLKPGTLPWSTSWYLTGYADEYLMKQKFITEDQNSIQQTREDHDLTPHRAEVESFATSSPAGFSAQLRSLIR